MLPSHWVAENGPLNEQRPSLATLISFENRRGSILKLRGGGGGVTVGGRLCEILAKWGVGVYPDRGVNQRGYGMYTCWNILPAFQYY